MTSIFSKADTRATVREVAVAMGRPGLNIIFNLSVQHPVRLLFLAICLLLHSDIRFSPRCCPWTIRRAGSNACGEPTKRLCVMPTSPIKPSTLRMAPDEIDSSPASSGPPRFQRQEIDVGQDAEVLAVAFNPNRAPPHSRTKVYAINFVALSRQDCPGGLARSEQRPRHIFQRAPSLHGHFLGDDGRHVRLAAGNRSSSSSRPRKSASLFDLFLHCLHAHGLTATTTNHTHDSISAR